MFRSIWSRPLSRLFDLTARVLLSGLWSLGVWCGLTYGEAISAGQWAGLGWSAPAIAAIHTYHERPGQTTFRSQLSLRDRQDRAWQLIVFHRFQQDQSQGIMLRLVGFPGAVELAAQHPLQLSTRSGQRWTAPIAPELDFPPNVQQYNLTQFMVQVDQELPLDLLVPLADGNPAEIVVPPFAVAEWQAIARSHPAPADFDAAASLSLEPATQSVKNL